MYKALLDGVQEVAVKIFFDVHNAREEADILREVAILKGCRDRNVVQFYGACHEVRVPPRLAFRAAAKRSRMQSCPSTDAHGLGHMLRPTVHVRAVLTEGCAEARGAVVCAPARYPALLVDAL